MSKIKPQKQHSSFFLNFKRRNHQNEKNYDPKKIKMLVIG